MDSNSGSTNAKIKQFRIDTTKNTGESLKESHLPAPDLASIQLLIESIPAGVVLCRGETLVLNERAEELLGGSAEFPDVFQENLNKLFHFKNSYQTAANSKQEPQLREVWFVRSDHRMHLCEVTLPNNTEQELWLINDITVQRQNERLLHLLSNATSGVTGEEFFKGLVQELSRALNLKAVFLVRHLVIDQEHRKCQAIGACLDGKMIPNFEYDVAGTPCENAVGPDPFVIHQGVAQLYPQDQFLIDHKIEAYFSVPMINRHGAIQGHLILLSDRPISENLSQIPAIKNYTFRAATEVSRQQAEKKLQESELRVKIAARGSDIGFWDYDLKTGQIEFDDNWYLMLGYRRGRFPGTFSSMKKFKDSDDFSTQVDNSWTELIHPDDLPFAMEKLDDYISGRSPSFEIEIRVKHVNGDWKWISTRGKISEFDSQNNPTQIIGTHIDIDDLKRSQQIRLENEARLNIIMNQIPAILWTTDKQNEYTSIVGAGLNQLGIQPNEPIGQTIFDFQETSDASQNMLAMHQRTLKGESVRFEQQIQNTILDIHIEPLRDSKENIIGCIGLAIDVTVRKKTIEQLNRQRILLQTIFHSVTDAMIVTDRSHNIVMCNESIQIHFRCKEADLLGKPIQEIITSGEQFDDEFLRVSYPNSRVLKPFIVEYKREDGTKFQGETIITPLRRADNQITGYIQVIRDITDRIQIEEEKDQLHAQMLHAQKLESLGVLAGGIAHDFNNLLLAILGNTNLALMELGDQSPVTENVKNIEIAARHATKICERLLAYSGRRTFVTTTFNLNQIIQETVEILKTIVSPNAEIVLELAPQKLLIHGDVGQIEQVVLNLLTNASEAIQNQKETGVIHIRTGVLTLTAENSSNYFFCENITPGEFVYFEIEDTGGGMDEDCQTKMFDPFFTTKFTGRGLGLAGVSGIIRGHNGGLYVESAVDLGSCFRVILPVATKAEEKNECDSSVDTIVPADAGYVLVIDDDKAVCNVVNHVLNRFGFSVMVAHSGQEGIDTFLKNRDGISIILLDMTMPGLSGVETYQLLKEKGIDIPVILTSGLSESDIADQMDGSEILHFLKKPYKPQKLVNMVSKTLLRHQIQDDSKIHFK